MRTSTEIRELLDELNHQPAREFEDQDLDFKEWNFHSMNDSVTLTVEMAICMANGGGGPASVMNQMYARYSARWKGVSFTLSGAEPEGGLIGLCGLIFTGV